MTNRPDPWIGKTLAGRYEVHAAIAEGGMGRVYRGVQRTLERPVAIKRMHPHLATAPGVVSRFMGEARLVSRLSHPNIVKVFDFGRLPAEDGGDLFLVMELLEGIDLATMLSAHPNQPLDWCIEVMKEVLAALEEAHAQGVVHRDVKPENIVILPTRSGKMALKLIDFGIAKVQGVAGVSAPDEAVGTPEYMAPEQVRGEPADARTDLYAAGVVLFRMLTGRPLFGGDSPYEILQRQLSKPRPDPRLVAPERGIPEGLAAVCSKAIAIDRGERFGGADELIEALTEAFEKHGSADTAPETLRDTRSASVRLRTPSDVNAPPSATTRGLTRSARYTIVHKRIDFRALHRLDAKIMDALAAGNCDAAIAHLEDGVERARLLSNEGSVELATVAWTSFGRRLAAELRRKGRHDRAAELVAEALSYVGSDADARAALLDKEPGPETLTLDLDELDSAGPGVPPAQGSAPSRASGIHPSATSGPGPERSTPRPHAQHRR
jgi:serine/threonine-protein kinase